METPKIVRGRLIDHIQLVVADIDANRRFYVAALGVLGIEVHTDAPDYFWSDELFVSTADSKAASGTLTGRVHLAFQANDKETVEKFYKVALEAGGRDGGKPGERPYHPGYYAAFVSDPAGNNIEAVYHGQAKRSADQIDITF